MELDTVIHGVETSNLDAMKHGVDPLGPKLSLSFSRVQKRIFFKKKDQIVKNWGGRKLTRNGAEGLLREFCENEGAKGKYVDGGGRYIGIYLFVFRSCFSKKKLRFSVTSNLTAHASSIKYR